MQEALEVVALLRECSRHLVAAAPIIWAGQCWVTCSAEYDETSSFSHRLRAQAMAAA